MTRAYFDSKAQIWDEAIAEKDQRKLKSLADRLDIARGSTGLDAGTGTGIFVPFILNKVGEAGRLICLDFAEKMLKVAKSKGFKGNIEYICADIAQTQLDDGVFDFVVCYSSFPHFQDKLHALNEINRILKTGGKLFICHSSSRDTINELHRRLPEVCHDLIPGESTMRRLLRDAHFKSIEIVDGEDTYLVEARK